MKHTSTKPLPVSEGGMGNPISPSGGGLIEWVESIGGDLTPLLAKAGLPSDLDALAVIKLAKKLPVAPPAPHRLVTGSSPVEHRPVTGSSPAEHRPVTGSSPAEHRRITGLVTGSSPAEQWRKAGGLPAHHRPATGSSLAELWRNTGGTPARYRLVTTVTSDNTPADAAHEAGMAVRFLVGLLQANTDRDRDDVARLAFTAGMRLAELKAILNSQPPIKAKPRSPFFPLAKTAWDNCLARKKNGGRAPQDKELIAEMIALGMNEDGDVFGLASGKNRSHRLKARSLLNNFTRWRKLFTNRPE